MNVRPGVLYSNVRLLRLARALYEGREVTALWCMKTFGVSRGTANKDLRLALLYLPCERIVPPRRNRLYDVREHRVRVLKEFRQPAGRVVGRHSEVEHGKGQMSESSSSAASVTAGNGLSP